MHQCVDRELMVTSHTTDLISGTWETFLRCSTTGAGAISASGNGRDAIQNGGRKRKFRLRLLRSIKKVPYTTDLPVKCAICNSVKY